MPPKKTIFKRSLKTTAVSEISGESVVAAISAYATGLSSDHFKRYLDKLSLVGNVDPYLMNMRSSTLPKSISYESIINYALYKQSSFSGNAYHCFKAMESKKFYESGLVRLIEGKIVGQFHVIRGRVLHSMSFNESPLTPWIIINRDKVICAHCDCVAGLGEVCSHIGAVLYALVHLNHINLTESEPIAVTSMEQQWGKPKKNITAELQQPLSNIEFGYNRHSVDDSYGEVPQMTISEIRAMCNELKQEGYSCVTMQAFCSSTDQCYKCIASKIDESYSQLLMNNLHSDEHLNKPIERLRYESLVFYDKMKIRINSEMCGKVERDTRAQYQSDLWKNLRIGRITASILKRVCCTNIETPSISLLRVICYPDTISFSTQATRYGKNSEKVARRDLTFLLQKAHQHASVSDVGLIIDSENPELAASPDGLLKCSCCGNVPIEIKCPFTFKDDTDMLTKLCNTKQPYIKRFDDGFRMVQTHAYYSQMQMQIFLCNAPFGYFYVWSKHRKLCLKVPRDETFWVSAKRTATAFFKAIVLPELFSGYFTRNSASDKDTISNEMIEICRETTFS